MQSISLGDNKHGNPIPLGRGSIIFKCPWCWRDKLELGWKKREGEGEGEGEKEREREGDRERERERERERWLYLLLYYVTLHSTCRCFLLD